MDRPVVVIRDVASLERHTDLEALRKDRNAYEVEIPELTRRENRFLTDGFASVRAGPGFAHFLAVICVNMWLLVGLVFGLPLLVRSQDVLGGIFDGGGIIPILRIFLAPAGMTLIALFALNQPRLFLLAVRMARRRVWRRSKARGVRA